LRYESKFLYGFLVPSDDYQTAVVIFNKLDKGVRKREFGCLTSGAFSAENARTEAKARGSGSA
jgi:hypothetical protein